MRRTHITTQTDSYKEVHHRMYPIGTEVVYSYFEARPGAEFDETVFFGLQYLLHEYLTKPVTQEDIEHADELCAAHFNNPDYFNRAGWQHIVDKHDGKLPLRIRAVPEGTPVPTGNVMMTVENTCRQCWWLTNFVESLLLKVWYPSTVASKSRTAKQAIAKALDMTSDTMAGLDFMLHDFGYRGASSEESAAIGGAAHLLNFKGTDTIVGIELLNQFYDAPFAEIAYSVAATEHSIMTSLGRGGEEQKVQELLRDYPTGILSVVADSYDIYRFVDTMVGHQFKERILARPEGSPFVVRPDSTTKEHTTPEAQVVWILESLWRNIGGVINSKGYRVLHPNVRVLWGDGIDLDDVNRILASVIHAGFSVENIATFGMGGGLLQKVNRDTQRFAFKSSAQKRDGMWFDVWKEAKGATAEESKSSKRGRLKLAQLDDGMLKTMRDDSTDTVRNTYPDLLQTVYLNGEVLVNDNLADIRERALIAAPTTQVEVVVA